MNSYFYKLNISHLMKEIKYIEQYLFTLIKCFLNSLLMIKKKYKFLTAI